MSFLDRFREKLDKVRINDIKHAYKTISDEGFESEYADLDVISETYQRKLGLLTEQEYEIFMFLREGFSTRECSKRTGIKAWDINKHMEAIYRKLGVKTITELIVKYRNA